MENSLNITEIFQLKKIASDAGDEILRIYGQEFMVDIKEDKSPLTEADRASNIVIQKAISVLFPDIPILSEENRQQDYSERKDWSKFWLIDPLDGTKEFISRNGEFTVNIALIENGYPVFGMVYIPVTGRGYYGVADMGAFSYLRDGADTAIYASNHKPEDHINVVGSRSHMDDKTLEYVEKLKPSFAGITLVSKGSSLKFCMVAEGYAACYPRFGPTMEWDTGAGQAIAEAAGCRVMRADTHKRMSYNKENLLNPSFIVAAPDIPVY